MNEFIHHIARDNKFARKVPRRPVFLMFSVFCGNNLENPNAHRLAGILQLAGKTNVMEQVNIWPAL